MFYKNVRFAFRALNTSRPYALLNLLGLVIGLSACLLIVQYIAHERSFDGFHAKKDQIFRINYDVTMGGTQVLSPSVPVFVAPQLKAKFPEIVDVTRFSSEWRPRTIRHGEVMFDEPGFCYADPNFFQIFDFQAIQGNLQTALDRPNTLVLTEKMARKYFGNSNPVGETLNFNNKKDYQIAAVVADMPSNSHFSFNFLTSHYSLEGFAKQETEIQWNNPDYTTWVLLQPGANPAGLAEKIEKWVNPPSENGQSAAQSILHLPLEPLSEVHFNTEAYNFGNQMTITDPKQLSIFGIVAALILLIACFNYVNMATARASVRAREVGIRKAVGARFGQLVMQFLSESFLLLLPAFLISMAAARLFLPTLNDLLDKNIPFRLFEPHFLAGIAAGWVLLSLLAGLYPALVLSRFRPMATLKGNFVQPGGSGLTMRKGLVVFQFAISTLLIVGTIVVQSQLRYMRTQALGLDKEQVVFLRGNVDLTPKLNLFCEKIRDISAVESVAQVYRSPSETVIGNGFSLNPNPTDGSDWHMVGGISADANYLQTLGIQLIAGRNFDPSKIRGDSTENEFIVNEAFLKHYNLKVDEALGRKSLFGNAAQRGPGTIVGVVRDFHTASMRSKVEPIVLFNDPDPFSSALVRVGKGQDMARALAQVESAWRAVVPMRPFNVSFLDEQYGAMYRSEQRMGALMSLFSGLAILVACLGLFGLAAFTVSQRTKEIGIRKVLGASVAGITGLLARDFLKLVLVAIVLASPVAYFFMQRWLADFAYRIDIQWWMFVVAGAAAVAIAFLTVGFQSVRAALVNPVKSLRSE
jgi:putative ABC transport system permease protein